MSIQQAVAHSALNGDESGMGSSVQPGVLGDTASEVRMNKEMYEFVRGDSGGFELYSVEGLEAAFRKTKSDRAQLFNDLDRDETLFRAQVEARVIDFPVEAQEIKAEWKKLDTEDKSKYHWRTVEVDGTEQVYILVGLHIITKDLPNWFWCTFQHADTLDNAVSPNMDSHTGQTNGVHPDTVGSKWENYRLRGTQIDFTDLTGKPTILANTLIEKGFQRTSSCISCHARAAVSEGRNSAGRINALPIFESRNPLIGSVGSPDTNLFYNQSGDEPNELMFLPIDFVWSAPFRAHSSSASPSFRRLNPIQLPRPAAALRTSR